MNDNWTEPEFSDIHVLVIDDDPYIVELVVALLRDIGVREIRRADGVVAALQRFSEKGTRIRLIICDWMMPGMEGIEFLRQVRSIDADVPFLMLTSKSTVGSVQEAMDLGVTQYISKPFNLNMLRSRLVSLLTEIAEASA